MASSMLHQAAAGHAAVVESAPSTEAEQRLGLDVADGQLTTACVQRRVADPRSPLRVARGEQEPLLTAELADDRQGSVRERPRRNFGRRQKQPPPGPVMAQKLFSSQLRLEIGSV